jgi:selenocysteine lyase/cysteine desulfurase
MGASLELLLEIGIAAIQSRVIELTDYLCERAKTIGLEVYSSRRLEDKSGIVSLVCPQADPIQLVRRFKKEGVVINQRAGRLRISPHFYNTQTEIDRLIDLLQHT